MAWDTVAVASAAMVALGTLALWQISRKPFWLDEATSILYARKPILDLVATAAATESNMATYYLVLHVWRFLGESELWIRALSVIFAVGSIPALYLIGRPLFGRRAAMFACVVFSTNALVVAYGQEARGYTLLLFLLAWSTVAYLRALERDSVRAWIAYGLLMTAALYSHYFAVFVLIAHGIGFLARRPRPSVVSAIPAIALLSIAVLSIAAFVLLHGAARIAWITPPTPDSVWATFGNVTGGGPIRALASIGLAAFALAAIPRWWALLLLTWAVLPFVGALLISAVQPVFLSRYLIVATPAIALLSGAALARLRLYPALIAALLVSALAVPTLAAHYSETYDDWRSAAAYVATEAHSGDLIIFNSASGGKPFELYLDAFRHAPLVVVSGASPVQADRVWIVFWKLGYHDATSFRNGLGKYKAVIVNAYGGVSVQLAVPR